MGSRIRTAVAFVCVIVGVVLLLTTYWNSEQIVAGDTATHDKHESRVDVEVDNLVFEASPRDSVEIIVSGRVVDSSGTGIKEALVTVEASPDGTHSTTTGEDGSFLLGLPLASNPIDLEVSASGFVSTNVLLDVTETDVRVILLRTGHLIGRAIDFRSNRPVERFTVSLFRNERLGISNTPDVNAIFDDETGRFVITDLTHEQFDLFARADGYQPVVVRGIAVSDQTSSVVLEFAQGREISGRVVSKSSGQAISGAKVFVADASRYLGGQTRIPAPGQFTYTSKDGTFALTELSKEDETIQIVANGFVSKSVDVRPGELSDTETALTPASTVAGRLIGLDGSSPQVGAVRLVERKTGTSYSKRSNNDGSFVFSNLPPAEYSLSALSSVGQANQIEFALSEAEHVVDLQLQIQPGIELVGRISGLMTGEEILGVSAKLAGQPLVSEEADVDGRYRLRGLPAGLVEIVVRTTKRRSLSQFIELGPVNVSSHVDFVFDGTSSVYGRISGGGATLKGKLIELIPTDNSRPSGNTRISADGKYEIEGLADGEHELRIGSEKTRYVAVNGRTQIDVEL